MKPNRIQERSGPPIRGKESPKPRSVVVYGLAVKIRNLHGVGINVVDIERFVDAMLVHTLVQIVSPVRVQILLGSGKPRLR